MGVSHALLAWPWGLALIAIAYQESMDIPARWSVPLGLLASVLIIPLAAAFLRP